MAKMIAVLNPSYTSSVSVDTLANSIQICPPPDFEVDRPTLVDLFDAWNEKFHSDEDNHRAYRLVFNFAGRNKSISEIGNAGTGNVVKAYINDSKAENQQFVHTIFNMLEEIDEVNYLL